MLNKSVSKILPSSFRNASLGMCQCEKADWRNLQRGLWSSVMSPYDKQYIDVKFSGDSSASVTVSVAEGWLFALFLFHSPVALMD